MSPPPRLAPPKSHYLALGDSIGYGFQTSKALAGLPPEAFSTGYADLFAARLRQLPSQIATRQLFLPGRVDHFVPAAMYLETSGHALHNDYTGSQLGAALAFLATQTWQFGIPGTELLRIPRHALNRQLVSARTLTAPAGVLTLRSALSVQWGA